MRAIPLLFLPLLTLPQFTAEAGTKNVRITGEFTCVMEPDCHVQTECLTNDASECTEVKVCNGEEFSFALLRTDGKTQKQSEIVVIEPRAQKNIGRLIGELDEANKNTTVLLASPEKASAITSWVGFWRKDNSLQLIERRTDGPPSEFHYTGSCEEKN